MKGSIPVLCPVYKASKKPKRSKQGTSDAPTGEQVREQAVNESILVTIRKELTLLPTCSSQVINTRVAEHLECPNESDRAMLDAWERCGRQDYKRALPVKFRHVIKETFSALGIACLIRYARGYLDEAEAAVAATQRRD